jgi:cold shock CspA family protein
MVLGQVKWFNAKAGFGFVTVLEGERKESEVFVHHSGLKVEKAQFRYLVEGEYVSLEVSESTSGANKFQGANVTGVLGGRLMCETRSEASLATSEYKSGAPRDTKSGAPRDTKSGAPRDAKSGAPRDTKSGAPRDTKSGTTKSGAPRYTKVDTKHKPTPELAEE